MLRKQLPDIPIDEGEIEATQAQRQDFVSLVEAGIELAIRNDAGIDRIYEIPDGDWLDAVSADKRRNWQAVVDDMSDVQKIVHLAIRMTEDDEQRIRDELLRVRKDAYVDELNILARRVKCNRSGRLTTGPTLSEFSDKSSSDAQSIVNTYNYDVTQEIQRIKEDAPSANRATYASRLLSWENTRSEWKVSQIALQTAGEARGKAQQDFYAFNDIQGVAVLRPKTAKEEICQGWANRGKVDAREANNNPPPYHPFCDHTWHFFSNEISSEECRELWLGE